MRRNYKPCVCGHPKTAHRRTGRCRLITCYCRSYWPDFDRDKEVEVEVS